MDLPSRRSRFIALLAALLLGLLAVPALPWAAGETTSTIEIYNFGGGPILYRGTRTETVENGRMTATTEYVDANGRAVQRTVGVHEIASRRPVSYLLEDLRSGEQERIEVKGAQVVLAYRVSKAEAGKESTLALPADAVFSPTVVPFMKYRWDALRRGESFNFPLLVPSRRDIYTFRVSEDKTSPLAGPGKVVMRMEPGTWLIRQLVDPLYFVLRADGSHELLEFHGRASIKTDGGETQDLRHVYP